MNEQLFNQAVTLLRKGWSTLAIADELEKTSLGRDILDIRTIVAEAASFVTEFQTKSFEAAVEAFHRGESRIDVEAKLRKLGFHSWDAMIIANRAQQKAETTDTPTGKGNTHE